MKFYRQFLFRYIYRLVALYYSHGTPGMDIIDVQEQSYFLREEKIIPSNPMRKEASREYWVFNLKNKSWRYPGIHRNMFSPSVFHLRQTHWPLPSRRSI